MSDYYVLTPGPASGGALDLATLRRLAVADAAALFRRERGDDVLLTLGSDRALAPDDELVVRWAQWLIGKLVEAGQAEQDGNGAWRCKTRKLHEENERRLDGLAGWSKEAAKSQRKLLAHVDAPDDAGNELEQSLSKLAAAGWSVEAKGDKAKKNAEPEVYYAAGELPLSSGADWQDPAAVHPRLAAALASLLAPIDPSARDAAQPGESDLAGWLPASLTVVGFDGGEALLDLRTVAKALRDAGGLDIPDGEPLGAVVMTGRTRLRAVSTAADNGSAPEDPELAALIDAHGEDAVRFALLHAAAPGNPFSGGADVVGYAAAVLARLRALVERYGVADGAGEIDAGDGLRRRLARWCDTATTRVTENLERHEPHRATRNCVELLERIEDFERRVDEYRGEVAGADREAIAVALGRLLTLVKPLAPALADDLTGSLQQG